MLNCAVTAWKKHLMDAPIFFPVEYRRNEWIHWRFKNSRICRSKIECELFGPFIAEIQVVPAPKHRSNEERTVELLEEYRRTLGAGTIIRICKGMLKTEDLDVGCVLILRFGWKKNRRSLLAIFAERFAFLDRRVHLLFRLRTDAAPSEHSYCWYVYIVLYGTCIAFFSGFIPLAWLSNWSASWEVFFNLKYYWFCHVSYSSIDWLNQVLWYFWLQANTFTTLRYQRNCSIYGVTSTPCTICRHSSRAARRIRTLFITIRYIWVRRWDSESKMEIRFAPVNLLTQTNLFSKIKAT